MSVDDRELDDGETVWCAHCSWCAVRAWSRQTSDAGWAMRVLAEHIRDTHPERLVHLQRQPELAARAG